jgi:hypothetical protein
MRDRLAALLGAGMLGLFALLSVMMLGMLRASEQEWSRAVYVFSGVQAIACAAAGFLFGREVHRGRAETAERHAQAARIAAEDAEQRGAELAEAVRRQGKPRASFDRRGRGDEAGWLTELADRLFPAKDSPQALELNDLPKRGPFDAAAT